MKDQSKTKQALIQELISLRQRVSELERSESERKRMEEALRESEENFRSSFDDSPLGIRIVTMEGETIYANRAILDIYGYDSIEELRTTPVRQRYTPESYAQFQIRMEERQRGDVDPSEYEISIVRKSGEVRHLQVFRKKAFWNGKMQFQVIYRDITDHKKMEEVLRESEEKYRNLVERANDGITIIQDGIVKYANPRLIEIWGGTAKEVPGSSFINYIHPDELPKVVSHYQKRMAGEDSPTVYETRLRRRDGKVVYAELSAGIIPYEGKPADLVIVRDITERRQAEDALRESEEKYRHLVAYAPAAIYELDLASRRFISVNDVMCQLSGYTREEFLSLDPMQLLAEESRNVFMQRLAKAFSGEQVPDAVEYRIRGKNGREFCVLLNTKYSYGPENRITATVVAHDITERKRLEEELILSEKKYRNLVDNTLVGVYQTNLEGRILFANQAFADMFGYDSPQELLSINVISLYKNKEDRKKFIETIRKERQLLNYDLELVTKDGEARDIILSGVLDGDSMLGTLVDITERKQLESQLLQARKMESLGNLASGAAHEIRNPLNIISLRLQMLDVTGKAVDDDVRQVIDTCNTQINRITRVLDGLYEFSRMPQTEKTQNDLNKIIEEVVVYQDKRFKDEGITPEIRYGEDIPSFMFDKEKISMVITHLISNAVDAMRDQEARHLRISTEKIPAGDKAGENVRIIISDSGHGIKELDQTRIFDPFFTTKGPDKGKGLGLAVSYGIIRDHGGTIRAENNDEGGATFFIDLPAGGSAKI